MPIPAELAKGRRASRLARRGRRSKRPFRWFLHTYDERRTPLLQDSSAPVDTFPNNIRRLLLFHHQSAKEAAEFVGVSPHAVSAWITGKRRPSSHFLIQVARLYDFDTRVLVYGDDVAFARELARPERIAWATSEVNLLRKLAAGGEVTDDDLAHRAREVAWGDAEALPDNWDERLDGPSS